MDIRPSGILIQVQCTREQPPSCYKILRLGECHSTWCWDFHFENNWNNKDVTTSKSKIFSSTQHWSSIYTLYEYNISICKGRTSHQHRAFDQACTPSFFPVVIQNVTFRIFKHMLKDNIFEFCRFSVQLEAFCTPVEISVFQTRAFLFNCELFSVFFLLKNFSMDPMQNYSKFQFSSFLTYLFTKDNDITTGIKTNLKDMGMWWFENFSNLY